MSSSQRPRAIFFGTPEIAVDALTALTELCDVPLVICQPDKPVGRAQAVVPPPVKRAAQALGLPVHQPSKVRVPEFAALLREQRADVAVVLAYGRILTREVLSAPRLGCVNLHASLLPKYRGAAPITWAIVQGEVETGICLMQMDEGLDTGPILEIRETPIGDDETAGDLFVRLAPLGAAMIRERVADVVAGRLQPRPQPSDGVTHARLLEKSDGLLDFAKDARLVHAWARGMTPWPGAQTKLGDEWLKVHGTSVVDADGVHGAPGAVVGSSGGALHVACGRGVVALRELQQAGRKRVSAVEFASGARIGDGARFGENA